MSAVNRDLYSTMINQLIGTYNDNRVWEAEEQADIINCLHFWVERYNKVSKERLDVHVGRTAIWVKPI